jgi:hypothetical protein
MNDQDRQNMVTLLLVMIGFVLTMGTVMMLMVAGPTITSDTMWTIGSAILGIATAGGVAWGWISFLKRIRAKRWERETIAAYRSSAMDPVHVAQRRVHDMIPHMTETMERIRAFEAISATSSLEIVVDTNTLISARIPAIMNQLADSLEGTTTEEATLLARKALDSVHSIGEMAVRARKAIIEERERALSVETQFVDEKIAPYSPDGLKPV